MDRTTIRQALANSTVHDGSPTRLLARPREEETLYLINSERDYQLSGTHLTGEDLPPYIGCKRLQVRWQKQQLSSPQEQC
jgi:hypothetical protein